MPFNDGDFVKVDYSAWRAADSKLVSTTIKKVAEENKELDEHARYEPQLIVIGKGIAIKGVEKAVRSMGLNESQKVEIEASDAFGERNSELVKVMSLADFKKRDIDPYPGMQLDLDGMVALVKSVNSGRVVVDANHPFAGERMVYEIKVVAKLDKDDDKVRAIAGTYSLTPDSVSVKDGKVNVLFGKSVEKDSRYLVNKNDFVGAVMRFMDGVSLVNVQEEYSREKSDEKKQAN